MLSTSPTLPEMVAPSRSLCAAIWARPARPSSSVLTSERLLRLKMLAAAATRWLWVSSRLVASAISMKASAGLMRMRLLADRPNSRRALVAAPLPRFASPSRLAITSRAPDSRSAPAPVSSAANRNRLMFSTDSPILAACLAIESISSAGALTMLASAEPALTAAAATMVKLAARAAVPLRRPRKP